MQTFSLVILLIFVMWLIDKHNQWRAAFKIVLGVVAVGILSLGGWYGWGKYEEHKANAAFDENAPNQSVEATSDAPCWTSPDSVTGVQLDQNSFRDLKGDPVPRDPNRVCHPPTSQTDDALAKRAGGIECFDNKTGRKLKDFYKEFGGTITACGPDAIEKPLGQCQSLISLPPHGYAVDPPWSNCVLPRE